MTNVTKKWTLAPFTTLADSFHGPAWEQATAQAKLDNEWFTSQQIARAADAIREHMLNPNKMEQWLARYSPPMEQLTVGIVMAGNLPMVGMADLLAVVASGHRAIVKPSSRDRALMSHACHILMECGCPVELTDSIHQHRIDRLIATGSDSTRNIFSEHYSKTTPTLLRGSRTSVAVTDDSNDYKSLASALADDAFAYWGMGCRNVTRILVPESFDPVLFIKALEPYSPEPHAPFESCYHYLRAREMMTNRANSHDARFFVLTHLPLDSDTTPGIAQLFYSHYTSQAQAEQWINSHDEQLQCVSTNLNLAFDRCVAIGRVQHPELWDYADGVDTMEFLK